MSCGCSLFYSDFKFPFPQKNTSGIWPRFRKTRLKKNMSDNRKLPKFGAKNQVNVRVYQKNIAPSKWYVKFQAKPA